jgi:carboxymethylenebutenolidase
MTEETVTIQTADGPMDAFVALPSRGGPAPALVVCQEAFGVNEHIKSVCHRLAAEGYVALAPELFHRVGRGIAPSYSDVPAALGYLAHLTNDGLTMDVKAALAALRERADVDPARVAVIGFCMGGYTSMLAACRTDVAAAVVFYGGGIVRPRPGIGFTPIISEVPKIAVPVICFFGEDDPQIPPGDIAELRKGLDASGAPHDIVVYPGAVHAFFCDMRPAAYNPVAAADAWRRTREFLERTLAASESVA